MLKYIYKPKRARDRIMKLIDIKNESQADPFIFEANGKFYVYATGIKRCTARTTSSANGRV